MGKKDSIKELINILAIALRHRIGGIVNPNEVYASKYAKDAEILINEARKIALKENWNIYDKEKIKNLLKKKLKDELAKRDFLDNKKFEIMNGEMEKALRLLGLEK